MTKDSLLFNLIKKEIKRQNETLNLIPSENYVSEEVLKSLGSPLSNKYAEGYSGLRYYGGNNYIDQIEDLAKKRALKAFRLSDKDWHVNVQPYSGSPANLAVYLGLAPIGEKIMGLQLDMGGHLTHGHKVSITAKAWQSVPYVLNKKTEQLDYEAIMNQAKKENPRIIVAGFTAYSKIIDWKKFRQIADSVGAYLMVDMSHIGGLVAGGAYPSPFPFADVVTTTTHKTLRGPRSAIIFASRNSKTAERRGVDIPKSIDKAVFPGLQGGPHMNQVASVATALLEASRSEFKIYARQVVKNAKALAEALQKDGWRVVSGGTESHLFLVDVAEKGIGGKESSNRLERCGIIVNKNAIPFDSRPPVDPSGIRLGSPSLTTRGMKEKEMKIVGALISRVLLKDENVLSEVRRLCGRFPLKYKTSRYS